MSTRLKASGPQVLSVLAIGSCLAFFQFGAPVGQGRLYKRVSVFSLRSSLSVRGILAVPLRAGTVAQPGSPSKFDKEG